MERRRSVRVKHRVHVTWRSAGLTSQGITWDICQRGAFINCSTSMPLNSIFDLELKSGDEKPALHCRCQVIWVNHGQLESFPPGFGVEFLDGGDHLTELLMRIGGCDLEFC
jgi:hypothetical protein